MFSDVSMALSARLVRSDETCDSVSLNIQTPTEYR